MKKTIAFLLMMAVVNCSFSQSKGQMDKRFNPGCVPKDVLNKEYTLLVKIPYKTNVWIKKYKKTFDEHYAGSYEIVPRNVEIKDAYADSTKYRYVLLVSNSQSGHEMIGMNPSSTFNPQGYGTANITHSSLFIVDRQKDNNRVFTGLESQRVMKIVAYVADKLSGKEGSEVEDDKDDKEKEKE